MRLPLWVSFLFGFLLGHGIQHLNVLVVFHHFNNYSTFECVCCCCCSILVFFVIAKVFLVYVHPLGVLVYLPFISSSVHYLNMYYISNFFLFIFVIHGFLVCRTIRVSFFLLISKDLMVEKVKKLKINFTTWSTFQLTQLIRNVVVLL
jgi:hypothetical protein